MRQELYGEPCSNLPAEGLAGIEVHLLRPEGSQGKSSQLALEKGSVSIPLDRIKFFLAKLSDERTTRSERMACWELIAKAARLGLEGEVQEMNELNAVMADAVREA